MQISKTPVAPIRLISTGKALPSLKVTSAELDERLSKTAGYVQKRSGLEYRYHAAADEDQAELGAAALHEAIRNAGIAAASIDLLISASAIPAQILPCTATHILRASCLPDGTPGFDVNLSCASFVVGMQTAAGFFSQNGPYRRIAVVSSELPSRGLNWDDDSALIFGDGAACAIFESSAPGCGLAACRMESYVRQGDLCSVRAGGTRRNPVAGMHASDFHFAMDGRKVFKMAALYLKEFQDELLRQAGCVLEEIDWVIPHQASHLGIAHAARLMGIPKEKLINIYAGHGNQVAASIPTALHEMFTDGRWQSGNTLMFIATAASLSLAGAVMRT